MPWTRFCAKQHAEFSDSDARYTNTRDDNDRWLVTGSLRCAKRNMALFCLHKQQGKPMDSTTFKHAHCSSNSKSHRFADIVDNTSTCPFFLLAHDSDFVCDLCSLFLTSEFDKTIKGNECCNLALPKLLRISVSANEMKHPHL